jgi:hypothetical protein
MALSQHQLDKAKKAIEFLSSLPTGSGEGSGTSGASRPTPTQSTSVRGSVNLSESSRSGDVKTEKGEYWYLCSIFMHSYSCPASSTYTHPAKGSGDSAHPICHEWKGKMYPHPLGWFLHLLCFKLVLYHIPHGRN